MAIRPLSTLYFADFELDRRAGQLRQRGVAVPVPRQQFQLLLALVAEPGALVSREQLRAELWGSDEFVDFDAGLNFCVRQLRLALGDSATQPRFIQTVPRRGYRFVWPVSESVTPDKPSRLVNHNVLRAAAVVTLIACSAGFGALVARASVGPAVSAESRIADAHAAQGFVARNDEWAFAPAERAFDRALQLDPGHEVALISMSRLRAAQGDLVGSEELARRALAAHPPSVRAQVTLGWTLLFAGDAAGARDLCAEALRRLPGSSSARACRLHAEIELGVDHRALIERRLAAVEGRPRVAGTAFILAALQARVGRFEQAMANLARALADHEPDASFAMVHPAFASQRTNPAFLRLTSAAGLSLGGLMRIKGMNPVDSAIK